MGETTIGGLITDGVLSMGDGYRTKRSEHGLPGHRIIRVADVRDESVFLDGEDFVSDDFVNQMGGKVAQPGDVLLTTKGTVGRVAVMPESGEPAVYSPQLCYFRIHDRQVLDPRYLRYWFRSAEFTGQSSYLQGNTDMAPYISLADLRATRITLPAIDRQRAIAEVLGALDDKIAANTRLAATADELAGAIVREAVDPSRTVRLESLASITMGSSPTGSTLNEDGEGTVFYQGVRDFGTRFPSRRVWTTSPTRIADEGDILVSVRAPVGEVNVANERICVGRGLAAVRSKTNRQHTLFHLLRHVPEAWAPYEAEGTVFGSINRAQLHGILLPEISSDRDEDQLESQIGALEMRIGLALRETEALKKTRDTLLPQLMSGTLRVREAAEMAGL